MEQDWKSMADDWYERRIFPHTTGAIDAKQIKCPLHSASESYNYKGFPLILFAMVSSDFKFTYIDLTPKSTTTVTVCC